MKLPRDVRAVWGLESAYRESTGTRERVCINGLWRWQPAGDSRDRVPTEGWGYFKVPGSWPGITNYMQKDCQAVHRHPAWEDVDMGGITSAWYEREITVPAEWSGRRIVLRTDYLNSFAEVYLDGKKLGEMRFPAGEVDLTSACRPGGTHTLSMLVVAMPLKGVMLSYNDTASAREVRGSVARRGLCGDVYLVGEPRGPRIAGIKVDTSVRNWRVSFETTPEDLADGARYSLRARITDDRRQVAEFTGDAFSKGDLKEGRITLSESWKPEKLWDVHTPQNMYRVRLSLLDSDGNVLDVARPVRFGFRELWIDGRDFILNGKRIFLSSVPLDNAQVGAAWATYQGARETMERLQSFGINYLYTHNYGCEPGSHLSFEQILRAADDVGMLIGLSQPHFGHYDWSDPDAEKTNGYAEHARFYVRVAQNHPSVVFYPTSHNACGYSEDMNPEMIDGIHGERSSWAANNVRRALRAQAIVERMDPTRILYHHSSGNLGAMHTTNFYANFAPIQEMSDWFEHWATEGVKPVFTCEYSVPMPWDWTMYRGWYRGSRNFGSAVVPWEFCVAEWNAQFYGDAAYRISEEEKENLRWEAEQFRSGARWHRWDYPHAVGSRDFEERYPIYARYFTDNWRAFRTWGMSANSPWNHGHYWKLRDGVEEVRKELETDWANLQRPGFSADYIEDRYERVDLAYDRDDWVPTVAAEALIRNNLPLLAYIAGEPDRFTGKDHNFLPGQTAEKQLVVINNSRETVTCDCTWSLGLPRPVSGRERVTVPTGDQKRVPLSFDLPGGLAPGTYELTAKFTFDTGETQKDSFFIHVLPKPDGARPGARLALFDPVGETRELLDRLGVRYRAVRADADLSGYDCLIVGKQALTVRDPAPDIAGVRDGLKVLVFEQTGETLEKRFGFRVAKYGLRWMFKRVPDHPALDGLADEHLRDWRGEATLLPPRLDYELASEFNGAPTVRWAGILVTRLWRCGNRGNVASVLIEKPPCGDFLPVLDGGYSLQYSPLMEYREGGGMLLFCQVDVTGRTETDPAADRLARNLLDHVSNWQPGPRRKAVYVGEPAGQRQLESAGVEPVPYDPDKLTRDHALVVGRGAGKRLAGDASAIARWLKGGGKLLALGLDAQEAAAFLPIELRTKKAEYIAGHFKARGGNSPLSGIGPAEVHNPAPRELPLVSGGATAVGNGVLGVAEDMDVVFCQLEPYVVNPAMGAVTSFEITDADAVDGERCALVTLGPVTERGATLGQRVEGGEPGKTYTFAVFVKAIGAPVDAQLEVERAGSPWDRAGRTEMVTIPPGDWREIHTTFTVDKPYPRGWSAYLRCARPGARYMVDMYRLYEGEYVPGASPRASARNLVPNPSFESDDDSWSLYCPVKQHNLKRAYRRTSFLLSRLLANMGVAGTPPLLQRFSTPIGGDAGDPVVRNGDFSADVDENGIPDEWSISPASQKDECTRERTDGGWSQRLICPPADGDERTSVMLSQADVPVRKGQWYRISFKARAEDMGGERVALSVVNTGEWRTLIEYQYFQPAAEWDQFSFDVRPRETVEEGTRFQVWYGQGGGKLWLADVQMVPITDPTEGRWQEGFYLDVPEEWDDPYRFFRW